SAHTAVSAASRNDFWAGGRAHRPYRSLNGGNLRLARIPMGGKKQPFPGSVQRRDNYLPAAETVLRNCRFWHSRTASSNAASGNRVGRNRQFIGDQDCRI